MASGYSITRVVGAGYGANFLGPGHVSIQINGPNTTTYLGFGPAIHQNPYAVGKFDVVTVDNGVSSVGATGNPQDEFEYVDVSEYPVKSVTLSITSEQVAAWQ